MTIEETTDAGTASRLSAGLGGTLLRPATRPPKPNLHKVAPDVWVCETPYVAEKAATPAAAYEQWKKSATIRGAAVMRSLRPFA